MTDQVATIGARLSLRKPQLESLALLDAITKLVPLEKGADLAEALADVRVRFPEFEEFERAFPSFCFALATGVGKTRLMGAFIAYLNAAHGIRHFLVLAPNLTIYDKLIRDFTPGNEKYVLAGLGRFATNPPVVITGDNYETGLGVRRDMLFDAKSVHINIFNIAKINAEVRGGSSPRIKRLAEYIGESYFEYLSELPDLVMLMDESHRYRATAGVRAINELAPVLGLELTATPHVEQGGEAVRFKNILYDYPLGSAMRDGFVKEPAVATRKDFRPDDYKDRPDDLDHVKLDDGFTLHEHTKVKLESFAKETGQRLVKPFLLVIAAVTEHADRLAAFIGSDEFRGGRYKGKVITVTSKLRGEERDETIQQLLSVEDPDNPIEVVVHVNMLKEGWDVRNLHTIVPLRTARAVTLVEQSIGRGLRLPYGKRTGVEDIDRLTIVAHDSFDAIVQAAKDPNSPLFKQLREVRIGVDVPTTGTKLVEADPVALETITGLFADGRVAQPMFANAADMKVACTTMELLANFGDRVLRPGRLANPEVRRDLLRQVLDRLPPGELLPGIEQPQPPEAVIERVIDHFDRHLIRIPRVTIVPTAERTAEYRDFDLDLGKLSLPRPDKEILIQELRSGGRHFLDADDTIAGEPHLENYLIRELMNEERINDSECRPLLEKLATQAVAQVRREHSEDGALRDVVVHHRRRLAQLIGEQLDRHRVEKPATYDSVISRDYEPFLRMSGTTAADEPRRNVHAPVTQGDIRGMVFDGLTKCAYSIQRFDSDPERRLASLLEREATVRKWVRPRQGMVRIHYSDDDSYVPDFMVETDTDSLMIEVKAASELADPVVQAKVRAAVAWCKAASEHAREHGDKPWTYVLVPDDAIRENVSLAMLVSTHRCAASSVA